MILLTGATGLIGSALLPRLIAGGDEVRCFVRDPTRLGPNRVRVQITLGDLSSPSAMRQAVRGVDTVVHLAASIRDQPGGTIEELNGLGTLRLLRAAEQAGVRRFIFFGALGATASSSTRFLRTKALARQVVLNSSIDTMVLEPSLVYAPGDPFLTILNRLSLLPWMPIVGSGTAAFQPVWAGDVADAVNAVLKRVDSLPRVLEIAGPDVLTYDEIVRAVLLIKRRSRPLVHVPAPIVKRSLDLLVRLQGDDAFATWQEAELMEVPMLTARGTEDMLRLGVEPKPMSLVLNTG